jgi:diaminohydroxyphosphoribosylaminopyrimidine deaminase / 5-amino-6-(5-phosphoribosylamino)uracil reductase
MNATTAASPDQDERWMDAALNLGARFLGLAAPNPAVGAILVKDGAVVGRGATAPRGRPHAERIAIAQAGAAARGSTLYVTLEPCSHFGASPPCADAVVEAGVARVVSAIEDPNPSVAGRGHARLRSGGVAVTVGPGANRARRDHRGHILRVTEGRPMVTLKLARTADGFASGATHDPRLRITGQIANLRVQVMRSLHDAIMIGVGTALVDDPSLTVRLSGVEQRPLRVILDSRLRLPESSRLSATAGEYPTVVLTTPAAPEARSAALAARGVEVSAVDADAQGHVDLSAALRLLAARGVTRVFSEGGPRVGSRLVMEGLADSVVLLTAERPLGRAGVPALNAEARKALADASQYRPLETMVYGADAMQVWDRVH